MVRELPGLSHFDVSSWNALAAPGKTPQAVVDRLGAEVAKVLPAPDRVQRPAGFKVHAKASTPAQLAQRLDADIQRWTEVIRKAGLTQQLSAPPTKAWGMPAQSSGTPSDACHWYC